MAQDSPNLIVVGGPNGAGKSTAAPRLLPEGLRINEYVNADVIAQGLSGFDAPGAAITAGRIMLKRLQQLARRRVDFAFEATLASQSLAKSVQRLTREGYRFHIIYLWLASPEMAVARVQDRVKMGGHSVPEDTVRRRYQRGLANLFRLYVPLARTWSIYDNSSPSGPTPIAKGGPDTDEVITNVESWKVIQATARAGRPST